MTSTDYRLLFGLYPLCYLMAVRRASGLSVRMRDFKKNTMALEIATCIGLLILAVPFEIFVTPNHRMFRLDDPSIQFPLRDHEQVPPLLLLGLVFVLPAVFIGLVVGLVGRFRKYAYTSILGFMTASFLNLLITDVLKIWIGNQRPDFLERCVPAPQTPTNVYVGIEVCTSHAMAVLQEGYKSTPSGHSSMSFCGLVFLALWLNTHLGTWAPGAPIYTTLAGSTPVLLAGYIAVSRIADYRHHWFDVVLGSVLGSSIAYVVYRRVCGSQAKEPEYPRLHGEAV